LLVTQACVTSVARWHVVAEVLTWEKIRQDLELLGMGLQVRPPSHLPSRSDVCPSSDTCAYGCAHLWL
jgi:sulfite reductase beta subunit-like hemoprotein